MSDRQHFEQLLKLAVLLLALISLQEHTLTCGWNVL